MTSATAQTGSNEMAPWAHQDARAARLRQRGRQADRRRPQRPPGVHATQREPAATGPYTWTPDKLFGFYYPAEQRAATTTCPAPRSSARAASSNDTWQNYLGVIGRQSRHRRRHEHDGQLRQPGVAGPGAAKAGGLFAGMAPITLDEASTDDPNQNADGTPLPQPRIAAAPAQLGAGPTSRCARSDRGRLRHPGHLHRHGRRDHLDA